MPEHAWSASDTDAVRALADQLRAEQPAMLSGTAWSKAARSYYARTGRIRVHGRPGYDAGCRCRACRTARSDYRQERKTSLAHAGATDGEGLTAAAG